MINITTKELEIKSELKRKIEFICDFCRLNHIIEHQILLFYKNYRYVVNFGG